MDAGEKLFVAADIGGTKTAVGLFSASDPKCRPLIVERYRNRDYDGCEPLIHDFQKRHGVRSKIICLGIAGVVDGPEVRVTNLPWVIDERSLQNLGFHTVLMINDMTAVAASLSLLGAADLHCLQPGGGPSGRVAAVLAPGTGLGEGYLVQTDGYLFPCGSEGGHCDFAPIDDEQCDYATWLHKRFGGVASYEMACCGPAIARLFDFYRERGVAVADETMQALQRIDDRTPTIVAAAVAGSCPASVRAVEQFLRILGREGAHLVLKVYARRGLFLGGGILPRLVGTRLFASFLETFSQPGTMADLLAAVPVQVIVKADHALLGVAWYAGAHLNPTGFRIDV